MCKALSPASFLAVAFYSSKQEELDYGWLNAYRTSMRAEKLDGESVDVSWDHDSVNYTMGFFSPIFSATASGVRCNLEVLNIYFKDITQEMDEKLLAFVRDCAMMCGKEGKRVPDGRRKAH